MSYNKHYEGCIKTPALWFGNSVKNIEQFQLNNLIFPFDGKAQPKLRLGKLVEHFITYQLQQDDTIQVLAENYQVQKDALTIGEIDCICQKNDIPIHLEIVYKFYLYDPKVGQTEIEKWIGPNRNDSLIQKLDKLKQRQLPLLYNTSTKPLLNQLKIIDKQIKQRVCFKAQLFTPFQLKDIKHKIINSECIKGFYIPYESLSQFKKCTFFLPKKQDWLLEAHHNVTWKKLEDISESINAFLAIKKSPMVWIKTPNNIVQKCFIVWW